MCHLPQWSHEKHLKERGRIVWRIIEVDLLRVCVSSAMQSLQPDPNNSAPHSEMSKPKNTCDFSRLACLVDFCTQISLKACPGPDRYHVVPDGLGHVMLLSKTVCSRLQLLLFLGREGSTNTQEDNVDQVLSWSSCLAPAFDRLLTVRWFSPWTASRHGKTFCVEDWLGGTSRMPPRCPSSVVQMFSPGCQGHRTPWPSAPLWIEALFADTWGAPLCFEVVLRTRHRGFGSAGCTHLQHLLPGRYALPWHAKANHASGFQLTDDATISNNTFCDSSVRPPDENRKHGCEPYSTSPGTRTVRLRCYRNAAERLFASGC